jgi:hypothetical protein
MSETMPRMGQVLLVALPWNEGLKKYRIEGIKMGGTVVNIREVWCQDGVLRAGALHTDVALADLVNPKVVDEPSCS